MTYQANEFEYYNSILSNSETLNNILFEYELYDDDDSITTFINSLVSELMDDDNNNFIFSGDLARDIYDIEKEKYEASMSYRESSLLKTIIEDNLYSSFGIDLSNKNYQWQSNEKLYVEILKSILYGYTTNFFYSNKEKFLPEYDWYLINQEEKRQKFMEALFKEYDKFSYVISSITNFVDIDKIPKNMISYLSNLVGISVNDYIDFINDRKIRTIVKNIIEVYNHKGSLYSLELFFACLGVSLEINELYFDRRLYYYYNSTNYSFNEEINSNDINSFKYYLTKKNPCYTMYNFTSEKVESKEFITSLSESIWNKRKKALANFEGNHIALELLGYENNSTDGGAAFTFFKTNAVSVNFIKFGYANETEQQKEERLFTETELEIFQGMIEKFMPVFIRKYFPYFSVLGTVISDYINVGGFLRDSNKLYDRVGNYNSQISEINILQNLTTESFDFDFDNSYENKNLEKELEYESLKFSLIKNLNKDEEIEPTFNDENSNLFESYIMADTGMSAYTTDDYYVIDYYDKENTIESIEFISNNSESLTLELS